MTDNILIEKIKNENCENSLTELIARHSKLCYKIYNRFSLPILHADKELIIYKSALSFNPKKNTKFSTWLANQVRYRCLNYLNREKDDCIILEPKEINKYADIAVYDNHHLSDANLIFEILHSLKDTRIAKLFEMRYLQGKTWDSIGEQLNVTAQTVINLHNKAKKKLKNRLTKLNTTDRIGE